MDLESLYISCPNGELKYPREVLSQSLYLRGSLIYEVFFEKSKNKIFLEYDIEIIKTLITFIRSGTYTIPSDNKLTKKECMSMINNLVKKENSSINELFLQMKNGVLNFLTHNEQFLKEYDLTSYPLVIHYDKKLYQERLNIFYGLLIKESIRLKDLTVVAWMVSSYLNSKTDISKLQDKYKIQIINENVKLERSSKEIILTEIDLREGINHYFNFRNNILNVIVSNISNNIFTFDLEINKYIPDPENTLPLIKKELIEYILESHI